MPTILTLPKIGVNMTEAIIVKWLVKEGDLIEEGQTILEAETDKAMQDIPATKSGVLAKIVAEPGKTVQTQEPIAILTEKSEELPLDFSLDTSVSGGKREEAASLEWNAEGSKVQRPVAKPGGRVRISPIAKKLAAELKVDYTQISPSKPGGRIEKADVLAFASQREAIQEEVPRPPEAGEKENTIPMKGIRKTIATRLMESAQTTARAVLFASADAGRLIEWRNLLKAEGTKASFNDLFVLLIAKALKEFPWINSRLEGEDIRLLREVNIGVAVDTERGLIVPVVHGADRKDVHEISKELQQMVERARSGKSTRDDLTGGTFTLTNLGMFEVESFIPIINPPECAIMAVGSIVREPAVVDDSDTVEIRPKVKLSLVFDHRLVDGAPAARFLQRVKELIEAGGPN
jgi:pyruvate dehydrogenase E2 component (dihydrolipoamide acetyltransferase)